jgi:uncharacterized protein (DUF2225 family)
MATLIFLSKFLNQVYGRKLNRLYRLNRMDKEQEARNGQVLFLRKKKPRE